MLAQRRVQENTLCLSGSDCSSLSDADAYIIDCKEATLSSIDCWVILSAQSKHVDTYSIEGCNPPPLTCRHLWPWATLSAGEAVIWSRTQQNALQDGPLMSLKHLLFYPFFAYCNVIPRLFSRGFVLKECEVLEIIIRNITVIDLRFNLIIITDQWCCHQCYTYKYISY